MCIRDRFWPASNTSRPQPCFSSKLRKAAKLDKWCQDWPQDQLHWLMIPSSGTNQSVEITTLQYPERTHLESWWIFYWDLPLRPPGKYLHVEALACSSPTPHLSMMPPPPPLLSRCITFILLYPKFQGPPSVAHLFYLNNFVNKLSLTIWVLALNFSLSQNTRSEVNTWCHVSAANNFIYEKVA